MKFFNELLVSIGFSSRIFLKFAMFEGSASPDSSTNAYVHIFLNCWRYFRKKCDKILRKTEKWQSFHQNYPNITGFHWFFYSDFHKFASVGAHIFLNTHAILSSHFNVLFKYSDLFRPPIPPPNFWKRWRPHPNPWKKIYFRRFFLNSLEIVTFQ